MTRNEEKSSGSIRFGEGIGRARVLGEGGSTGLSMIGCGWDEDDVMDLVNHGWLSISGIYVEKSESETKKKGEH